jgi:hypothetical protein
MKTTTAVEMKPPRSKSVVDLFHADAPLSVADVSFSRGEATTTACAFFPGQRMRRLQVAFTSQLYRGLTSEHEAVIYLPEGEFCDGVNTSNIVEIGEAPILELDDKAVNIP